MDKEADALRKQLSEEIEAQFESKLKQLKRQKEHAEEELESASERWRIERRRLNSEIDRLETALADARGAGRKRTGLADPKTQALDAAVIARLREEAEDKFKTASEEWETERTRLKSQINRLEESVAEAIARSSNPLRATQSVREQFEVELDRVAKDKTELEQAFLRSKAEWEQERLKLAGEMVKLRRAAQIMGRPVPREHAPEINPKVRDLENQLQEALAKWTAERENLVAEIHKLESASRQWDTERRQLNDHASQLQQAFIAAQARIKSSETAARTDDQQQALVGEIKRQKEQIEREFQDARNEWTSERSQLNSQIDRIEQQLQRMSDKHEGISSEVVEQLRKQYEQKLQEAIHQKTRLAQELQSASALLETERARLSAEIAKPKSGGVENENGGAVDSSAISVEVARVESVIEQVAMLIDDPDTELSTVIRKNVEKAELTAYLKGILFSLGRSADQ